MSKMYHSPSDQQMPFVSDIIEPGSKYVATKKPERRRDLQVVLLATKQNATLRVDGKLVSLAPPMCKEIG